NGPFLDLHVEAETSCDFRIAGIAKHALAAADQDGNLLQANLEMIEKLLDAWVPIHIEVRVRMAITREKGLQPQCVSRMSRPHQQNVAPRFGDQRATAQKESAKEDFAQLGIGLHHP